MADFEHDTAVHPRGDGNFECSLAEDWWVVAGPNGGYLAAIMARALLAAADGTVRPLRSLTVHYLRAPSAGPARVDARLERQGRSVTFASARLVQDERPCALALAVLADPREGLELEQATAPEVPPPEQLAESSDRPNPPPVAHQLLFRPVITGGPEEALTGGWLRLRREAPLDAPQLVALCDFWIPAVGRPRAVRRAHAGADGAPALEASARERLGAGPLRHPNRERRAAGGGRRAVVARRDAPCPVAAAGALAQAL